uniref:histidine tRNA synthetase n=1 Tax=Gloiopeltis furcata TaxID=42017 RepID=UPI0028D6295F|nr:histidine tRNA synthetase [Gloiopeltis furcata]WMP13975.1 histidine tRNA synthetase [Gloiopeltis furcata]
MQPLRGTKDILSDEILIWQHIYSKALKILTLSNYHEIRTPILESTTLFTRSIGNGTDIVNKEMYSFRDQGLREITLRPEGTASIARAFISNKLGQENRIQRLWYCGPMFRYERPQNGRQRQFHQLGIECIGSFNPMADAEVIRIAYSILKALKCPDYQLEINSIGNTLERNNYKKALVEYLYKYKDDLDTDSLKRLQINPLRILDSKNQKTQEILCNAPLLASFLQKPSKKHFYNVCDYLACSNIGYTINQKLVRGLDYYNYTAFEIKTRSLGSQDTICGGGRYDSLIQQLGGQETPSVGWAIGLERLVLLVKNIIALKENQPSIYLATQGTLAQKKIWTIISILEKNLISFELDLNGNTFQKQLKKASKSGAKVCLLLGEDEVHNNIITIKWLKDGAQEQLKYNNLSTLINKLKS